MTFHRQGCLGSRLFHQKCLDTSNSTHGFFLHDEASPCHLSLVLCLFFALHFFSKPTTGSFFSCFLVAAALTRPTWTWRRWQDILWYDGHSLLWSQEFGVGDKIRQRTRYLIADLLTASYEAISYNKKLADAFRSSSPMPHNAKIILTCLRPDCSVNQQGLPYKGLLKMVERIRACDGLRTAKLD